MSFALVSFHQEHLLAAARLVSRRYRALPPSLAVQRRFTPDAVLPHLRSAAEAGPGLAAVEDGTFIGFLLAYRIRLHDRPAVYVPDFGHAAVPDRAYALYRALYAELAQSWVEDGRSQHAVTLCVHEEVALRTWFSLGFGLLVTDAVRGLEPVPGAAPGEIRRATVDDLDLIRPLERALQHHLTTSPIFLPMQEQAAVDEWRGWFESPQHGLWLAFEAGVAVGYIRLEPREQRVLPANDPAWIAITGAYTLPAARGGGVATALLNHSLAWARAAGYRGCSVDFEAANLSGAGFWLSRGFQPVCYSVLRTIASPSAC